MGGAARESETSLDRSGREGLWSALGQFVENKMWERVEQQGKKNPHSVCFFFPSSYPFFLSFFNPDNQATRIHDWV